MIALGDLYTTCSRLESAQETYQEALCLAKSFSQRKQEAQALRGLGQVTYVDHDAVCYAEQSLKLCRSVGWKYGSVQSFNLLGLLALRSNDLSGARQYFYRSLSSELGVGAAPLILSTLCGWACLFAAEGDFKRALGLLAFVISHPKSHADTIQQTLVLREKLQNELGEDPFQATRAQSRTQNLQELVEYLLSDQWDRILPRLSPELGEPLTRTEREVLKLMDSPLTYPEIAERRHISVNTIKTHRSNIYAKLAVSSRAEALRKARMIGLLL